MNNLFKTILMAGAMSAVAFGQAYSNPVREMEKPGRSVATGLCSLTLLPGYSSDSVECTVAENGQPLGATIPAGKTLVIEDISASCIKGSADPLDSMRLIAGAYTKSLPAVLETTFPGNRQRWISSMPLRIYARPGTQVHFSAGTVNNATAEMNCTVRFTGHFQNVQ